MVDPINSTVNYQTGTAKGKSNLGKDDFMNLMIAQLKHQDPLNPMDGTEFSAQLAQFSSLEQLSNLNEYVKQSIDANYYLTQSINNALTANLIGKQVKLSASDFQNKGQEKINLGYNLNAEASIVKVNIYNENNVLVKTIEETGLKAGEHKLSWDFTDNNGDKLPEGGYHIEIEAKGLNGEELTAESFIWGKIDGVRFSETGSLLVVDNSEYDLASILEVVNPDEETEN